MHRSNETMPWWRRKDRGKKPAKEVVFWELDNTARSTPTGSLGSGFGGAARDTGSLNLEYDFGDAARGSGGAAGDALSLDSRIFGEVRGERPAEWNELMNLVVDQLNGKPVRNEDAARTTAFDIIESKWKGERETQNILRRDMYEKFAWENIRNMLTREPEPESPSDSDSEGPLDAGNWNPRFRWPPVTPPRRGLRYPMVYASKLGTPEVPMDPPGEYSNDPFYALDRNRGVWPLGTTASPLMMGPRLANLRQEDFEERPETAPRGSRRGSRGVE